MTAQISQELVITPKMVSTPVEQWDNSTFAELSVQELKLFRDNIAAIAESVKKQNEQRAERERLAEKHRSEVAEQIRVSLAAYDAKIARSKAMREAEVLNREIADIQKDLNQQQKTLNYLTK